MSQKIEMRVECRRKDRVIREELRKIDRSRSSLRQDLRFNDQELSELVLEAQGHPEISVAEAARIAGIGRSMAYKLMEKSGQSD